MNTPTTRSLLVAIGLGLAALSAAQADGGRMMPRDMPKAYMAECAACHTAYTPGLLPARSWQRIMAGLDKHYGTDASLDDATVKQLSAWLTANAGTGRRARSEPPQDRITTSSWFIREHDEVPAGTWKRPAVKSPSNCVACHTQADQGNYSERFIRIPR